MFVRQNDYREVTQAYFMCNGIVSIAIFISTWLSYPSISIMAFVLIALLLLLSDLPFAPAKRIFPLPAMIVTVSTQFLIVYAPLVPEIRLSGVELLP